MWRENKLWIPGASAFLRYDAREGGITTLQIATDGQERVGRVVFQVSGYVLEAGQLAYNPNWAHTTPWLQSRIGQMLGDSAAYAVKKIGWEWVLPPLDGGGLVVAQLADVQQMEFFSEKLQGFFTQFVAVNSNVVKLRRKGATRRNREMFRGFLDTHKAHVRVLLVAGAGRIWPLRGIGRTRARWGTAITLFGII